MDSVLQHSLPFPHCKTNRLAPNLPPFYLNALKTTWNSFPTGWSFPFWDLLERETQKCPSDAVLHSVCSDFQSLQQCVRAPFPPHPRQHLRFLVLLMTAVLTGVRWDLTVVLNFIFLMFSGIEHLFMCWSALCLSLGKCLLTYSAYFLIRLFVLFVSSCVSF